jgi:sugar transferase (PEP-CTERM/EpsH1 system associated)
MKILFLSHRVPFPLDKGDRIRSYNIIKFLAGFHSISLMSLTHESTPPESYEILRKYCATVEIFKINSQLSKLKSCFHLFTRKPLTLPNFYSRQFHRSVKNKLREKRFDLIYIYSSSMAQYVLEAKSTPKLMDFIDVDSEKWFDYATSATQPLKAIYYREGIRLRSFEKNVASLCDRTIFASAKEANLFSRIAPDVCSIALPNGVDLEPEDHLSRARGNKLVFIGVMDYLPNVDAMLYFTREVFPLIQKEIADAELFIVGRNPCPKISALRRLRNVTVTGSVEGIEPYLRDAAASVIPLRIARGIQNKILEAMAHGVPVITTSAALEGMEAEPGADVLVGDDPRAFAEMTIAVLKDKALRQKLIGNALALVRKKYSWEQNLAKLNGIIDQVCTH